MNAHTPQQSAEHKRLAGYREKINNWKHWGPYLSDRAWGTVREDYSPHGSAWDYFPHDHARSRTYRWNEDGLAGISDRNQFLCFALALWNGNDPILKERLFGLSGPEGNHGEDVKEVYFYVDSTPTHSYMKMLYKYPHAAYPYQDLIKTNRERGYDEPEYEIFDTGVFDDGNYFDVFVEYAKANQNDIFVKITAINRGDQSAELHLLPTLWFRNTWSWGYDEGPMGETGEKPQLRLEDGKIVAEHVGLGTYWLYAEQEPNEWLFTENELNFERLFGVQSGSVYTKDAFHRHIIDGEAGIVIPNQTGTKTAAHFKHTLDAGEEWSIVLRLNNVEAVEPFAISAETFQQRIAEADEFYAQVQNPKLTDEARAVQRQAFAGMQWSKQLYYYDIEQWLTGDPAFPPPSEQRKDGRNSGWKHLYNFDLISMPDKWEYPWYATWDLAFHTLPLCLVDPDFAKRQLTLFTREWYMHPNGQFPAYEWAFSDVNPPVHAWAAWRVYKIDAKLCGKNDRQFLEGIFHKLMLNFTWWVNRKDEDDNNVFQGGFLGLDNISVFDRSGETPGKHIDQADGTAWMGAYCLQLMTIALELAKENPVYQDAATKLFEHFLRIGTAMTDIGGRGVTLWDEGDEFFYDQLHTMDDAIIPLRVRSLVGLLPLFAVETIEPAMLKEMPTFARRMEWFMTNRPYLAKNVASVDDPGVGERRLAALLSADRLRKVLAVMLDEDEFLSPYGIRSLSKYHDKHPFEITIDGETHRVPYWPGVSRSGLFGGNSNWRGPVWFPINYLIIESLQKYHHYYGEELKVELPTGSGNWVTLDEVVTDLSLRLMRLFMPDENGKRPCFDDDDIFHEDENFQGYLHFHEFFHAETGKGLGASHQTGWTGLVAKLLQQSGELL